MPWDSKAKQGAELLIGESSFLSGPLDFDKLPFARHDEVHIDFGFRIFRVIEIEARTIVQDPDRCRGHEIRQGREVQEPPVHEIIDGESQGDETLP